MRRFCITPQFSVAVRIIYPATLLDDLLVHIFTFSWIISSPEPTIIAIFLQTLLHYPTKQVRLFANLYRPSINGQPCETLTRSIQLVYKKVDFLRVHSFCMEGWARMRVEHKPRVLNLQNLKRTLILLLM